MRLLLAFLMMLPTIAVAQEVDDTFYCLNNTLPVRMIGNRGYYTPGIVNTTNGQTFDARGFTQLQQTQPTQKGVDYPLDYRQSADSNTACFAGGILLNTNPHDQSWWDSKDPNNGGLIANGGFFTVDGFRAHGAHDSFRPWHDAVVGPFTTYWRLTNSWISWNRDDCIEADLQRAGMIDDNFVECYAFISTRKGSEAPACPECESEIITITDNVIHMSRMPDPPVDPEHEPVVDAHGSLFKLDEDSPSMVFNNNVVLQEYWPATSGNEANWEANAPRTLGIDPTREHKLLECTGVTIVWTGPGEYLGNWPAHCEVAVTTDIQVFNAARDQWLADHPKVARIPGID